MSHLWFFNLYIQPSNPLLVSENHRKKERGGEWTSRSLDTEFRFTVSIHLVHYGGNTSYPYMVLVRRSSFFIFRKLWLGSHLSKVHHLFHYQQKYENPLGSGRGCRRIKGTSICLTAFSPKPFTRYSPSVQ